MSLSDIQAKKVSVKEQRGQLFAHGSGSSHEWITYDGPIADSVDNLR